MSKISFQKPGNFLYPVPAVMVSCQNRAGEANIITVAWAGTVCSDPPMLSISVRKERHSYEMLHETGEFVVNLTSEDLVRSCDFCGCTTGAKIDKFTACHLTKEESEKIKAPAIQEAPVSLECVVRQEMELGTHVMFLAEVVCVRVDQQYLDEKGTFHMEKAGLTAYSHGMYHALGKRLGSFGFSVRKNEAKKKKRRGRKSKS